MKCFGFTSDQISKTFQKLNSFLPFRFAVSFGRKGSFIQAKRQLSGAVHSTESGTAKPAPSNEAIAAAIQEKVAVSVPTTWDKLVLVTME